MWGILKRWEGLGTRLPSYQSCIHSINKITLPTGVRALYKGLSPTIVRAFPANAALFVTFEYTNDFLKYKLGGSSSTTAYTDNS